uniref:Arrestin_C domain-containing protein n=1 Tax=Heterorhabditis bacteriophora TaxID=37862 RepID=A0A1I7WGI6_HETBA
MAFPKSFARILSISLQDVFNSSKDNQLKASIEVANDSEFSHSAQVVFRGYVKQVNTIVYEFLHEQAWILIAPSATANYNVSVDVWLPRFPPTMKIANNLLIEYSVKATIDPWFENTHIEKTFEVHRTLNLKMPHNACFPKHTLVNECIGHGGWCHRKCSPINGEIWTEKGAYTYGEIIRIRWKLKHELAQLEKVKISLRQNISYRQDVTQMLVNKEITPQNDEDNYCEIEIPTGIPITMTMTLWNVITVNYDLFIQIKVKAYRKFVELQIPLIISSTAIESRNKTREEQFKNIFYRAQDIDDDSGDDDDIDTDTECDHIHNLDTEFSINITNLDIKSNNGSLYDMYAEVTFLVNSYVPRPLQSLRMLFQGEVRAGSVWYSFLRYKALVSSDDSSLFSPGEHKIKVNLPFNDSQYDTNILPPYLSDDVRYICKISIDPWKRNNIASEKDVVIDRFVDTWAKEEFKLPFSEKIGAYGIKMKQRAFKRGKYAFINVDGNIKKVQLYLLQQRRLRQPGLNKDDSYCYERIVSSFESPNDKELWPNEWAVEIPFDIPPSIEISYWNVLILSYALQVQLILADGHEHKHIIPVWIGCTDDKLGAPELPKKMIAGVERSQSPDMGELPEFEVVLNEEVAIQPDWVERFNNHTYT